MARLTVGQKAQRLLAFLMGLGNQANLRALQPYGFGPAEQEEGWTLLRQAASNRLAAQRVGASATAEQIARLDAWENHWYPITFAVLQRNHPEVHDEVFLNLAQTEGKEVVLSVGTLVDRIDALPGGDDSPVRATLRKHGLTDAVLDEARGLLGQLMRPPVEEEPPPAEVLDHGAEDALWAYYLQWSAIARRAITDRRQLRQLGFLRWSRGNAAQDELPDTDAPDAPDAPDSPAS